MSLITARSSEFAPRRSITGISSKVPSVSLSPKSRGLPSLFGTSDMTVTEVGSRCQIIENRVDLHRSRSSPSPQDSPQSVATALLSESSRWRQCLFAFFKCRHSTRASSLVAACVSFVPSFNDALPTESCIFVFPFHSTLRAERFNISRACSDCPLILLIIPFALLYYLQDSQNAVPV